MNKFVIPVILFFTLTLAFFVTTILCDQFDIHSGYYTEGIRESAEVGN